MSAVQKNLVDMEISKILIKRAISVVQKDEENSFLSNLLLVGK